MKLYGLIGYPLGHSFSQKYFTKKFLQEGIDGCQYRNFPLETIGAVTTMIETKPEMQGFNVTIPYKRDIFPYLNELDPEAREIGAVNCVKITRNIGVAPSLKGYNTDAYGFERSLLALLGGSRPNALVLGTGGASKAVAFVLRKLGIPFRMVSRTGSGNILSYGNLRGRLLDFPLIINTTPRGTYPDTETFPDLPYDELTENHFLHDLVYNPAETAFMRQGRIRRATVKNGYDMLVAQAERAWQIWNEKGNGRE